MADVTTFPVVKSLLDDLFGAWRLKHGFDADAGKRAFLNIEWRDCEHLLESKLLDSPVVDRRLVGSGEGHKSGLVRAFVRGINGFPRLPVGGPYLSETHIAVIENWINAGCLDENGQAIAVKPVQVELFRWMTMRDPEVSQQSDIDPYPDGLAKIVLVWRVGMRFEAVEGSPIQIKVKGFDSLGPGDAFDQILQDDVYQNIGRTYEARDMEGRILLDSAFYGPTSSPFYCSWANEFPEPTKFYDFRRMRTNGRAFMIHWRVWYDDAYPALDFNAEQLPL